MNTGRYNQMVRYWMEEVENNCMQDAELTLKYCNDIIQYGMDTRDDRLMAFGYYYCGVVYYVLNDGTHFFDAVTNALSYLSKVEEWEMIARCYNFLGITAMSRGNAVIATDYYANAVSYSRKAGAEDLASIVSINVAALNLSCGRYQEALENLKPILEYYLAHPEMENCKAYCLCLYQNMAKAYLNLNQLSEAKALFDRIHEEYEDYEEDYTMVTVWCTEAIYYHAVGDDANCEKYIARVHKETTANVPILDMFEEYYDYCKILLERDKSEEFWHIIETIEPMVKSLNITNLLLKLIGLKIKSYRKYGKGAEYLQAAGLYYELSERAEVETKSMMNSVLNIRRSLEVINREKQEIEQENQRLILKSETDPLTQLNNRFRLNDYSEEIFQRCLTNQTPLAVEILDIDDFKGYNDNHGHQKGDECLVKIAKVLKSMQDEHGAFVARYGGDEFILIYEGITREQAWGYAKELRKKVQDMAISFKESPVSNVVTITQGICWDIPVKGNRMWDFLHTADAMLYRTKQKQRNNYCLGNLKATEDKIIMSC